VLKGWTRVTIASIVLLASAHRATAQQPIPVDSMALGSRMKARDESGSLRALPHIGTAVLATIVLLPLDRPIVTYCAGGIRSSLAASILEASGHDVANMRGGFTAWRNANLEISTEK